MNDSGLIITIKYARELLGTKARDWSDARVEEHINQLDFIATLGVRKLKSELYNKGGKAVPKST